MFKGATAFDQDLDKWNTGSVTDIRYAFFGATVFNSNISTWDVSQANSLHATFASASLFNQPIGAWDTSRVLHPLPLSLPPVSYTHLTLPTICSV
eukprot:333188-Rhodomonas_salina.1